MLQTSLKVRLQRIYNLFMGILLHSGRCHSGWVRPRTDGLTLKNLKTESWHFKLFLDIMAIESSGHKKKRIIQIVINAKLKSQHLSWCGRAPVPMGDFHICESTISTAMYIQVLEQHTLPSRYFSPCLFQQENAKRQCATTASAAWLWSKKLQVPNWPASTADLSPIENGVF